MAQMREADKKTIAGGVPSIALMERAGRGLADAVLAAMERKGAEEALFVCGGGNNGGDGFAAARMVLERGKTAAVLCLSDRFTPDCAEERARFRGEIFGCIPKRRYAVVADCVLGTGITRAPEGNAARLIEFINASGAYVLSADLPSGLSENGVAYSPCVKADETVCMGLMKNALLLCDGADTAGRVTVCDIGITSEDRGAELWEDRDVAVFFPKKKSNVNKGTFGSACILTGGTDSSSGAALLAAGACLKSGAGYTKLCAKQTLCPYLVGKLPSCILREYSALDGDILSSQSIAVGMGAGVSEWLYALLVELLPEYTGTLVLDADALNGLSRFGAEILHEKKCRVVVTPHPKEFARLIGTSVGEVLAHAEELARKFAREYGIVVVLKNNRTIITDGERLAINLTGSPVLAKGGSGDVLSGMLAGTCARGIAPFEAACVASYLLGRAGEMVAEELGEYAADATDILEKFPSAIKSVFENR